MDESKLSALNVAIEIAKLYVQAGLEQKSPAKVIKETYSAIVKISEQELSD